jgi:hypothetical protein
VEREHASSGSGILPLKILRLEAAATVEFARACEAVAAPSDQQVRYLFE